MVIVENDQNSIQELVNDANDMAEKVPVTCVSGVSVSEKVQNTISNFTDQKEFNNSQNTQILSNREPEDILWNELAAEKSKNFSEQMKVTGSHPECHKIKDDSKLDANIKNRNSKEETKDLLINLIQEEEDTNKDNKIEQFISKNIKLKLYDQISPLEEYLLVRIEAVTKSVLNVDYVIPYANEPPLEDMDLNLKGNYVLATDEQLLQFMNEMESSFEYLDNFMQEILKGTKIVIPIDTDLDQDLIKKKRKKMQKPILIPLDDGLRKIFPAIVGFTKIKFLLVTNDSIHLFIRQINLLMQKFMYSKTFNFSHVINSIHGIFFGTIPDKPVLTLNIVKTLYNRILGILVDLVMEKIKDNFRGVRKIHTRVEDILTKNEWNKMDAGVIDHLRRHGPFITADFVENAYINNLIAENRRIDANDMYSYYINWDAFQSIDYSKTHKER